MKKTNLIGENDKTIDQDSTSMNEELREWLKETKEEIKDFDMKKTSKKNKKEPKGLCYICSKNKSKIFCLKCGKSVCPSCYFNILGICKLCIPKELVERWEEKTPNWEKLLGVEWVD